MSGWRNSSQDAITQLVVGLAILGAVAWVIEHLLSGWT